MIRVTMIEKWLKEVLYLAVKSEYAAYGVPVCSLALYVWFKLVAVILEKGKLYLRTVPEED